MKYSKKPKTHEKNFIIQVYDSCINTSCALSL